MLRLVTMTALMRKPCWRGSWPSAQCLPFLSLRGLHTLPQAQSPALTPSSPAVSLSIFKRKRCLAVSEFESHFWRARSYQDIQKLSRFSFISDSSNQRLVFL